MPELRSPLTARGWAFLALSSAALTAGLARAELATLLWGSLFFFLCIASTALTPAWAATIRRRLRSADEPPRLRCARSRAEEGEPLAFSVHGFARFASRVPAVGVVMRIEWDWRGLRYAWAEIECSGVDDERISVTLPGRGRYDMRLSLIVRDTLGFARVVLPVADAPFAGGRTAAAPAAAAPVAAARQPAATCIHVLPRPVPYVPSLPRVFGGGRSAPDRRERMRSDDLLEVRRYVPGDDPRRINWKAFARHGELLIRIGEEIPRPRGHVLCVLHAGVPEGIEEESALALIDRSVSILLRLVEELVARRQSCDVLLPVGGASAESHMERSGQQWMEPGSPPERPEPLERLRARLADLAPADVLPAFPEEGEPHIFVVMPVGSGGSAGDPLPEIERRRLQAAVFLVAPPADGELPGGRRARERGGTPLAPPTVGDAPPGDPPYTRLPSNDRRLLQERVERDMLNIQSSLSRNAYVELV